MPLTLDTGLAPLLDVALTGLLILSAFLLIRHTPTVRLVLGVAILYGIYAVAQFFGLHLLSALLQAIAVVGTLALVVVFQPELRRALERIGRIGSFAWLLRPEPDSMHRVTREVARAAADMAEARQGALIVIERDTGLSHVANTGVMLKADLSYELLRALFQPPGALHDGAVLLRGNQVLAAGVVLPLSDTTASGGQRLGTRHRAALGVTEETDALAVVVSEERGQISLAERGRFTRGLDEEKLRTALRKRLAPPPRSMREAISSLNSSPSRLPRLRRRFGRRPEEGPNSRATSPTLDGPKP
jgi:diadenylate cyclase